MTVTAADTVKRTISGTIVTWNEQGNTSVGPTVFAKDSIEMKNVKLLLEHDLFVQSQCRFFAAYLQSPEFRSTQKSCGESLLRFLRSMLDLVRHLGATHELVG